MSRLPDKEGIEKIREAIKDHRYLCKQIADTEKLISKLEEMKEEAAAKHKEVIDGLENMDVKSNGNAGWERRIMWFLSELDRQAMGDV